MESKIAVINLSHVAPDIRKQIDDYTRNEFGHVPIVQRYRWAEPGWSVVVLSDDEVLSFLNVVEREALFDGNTVKLAGINNVITPAPFRRRGYASQTMRRAELLMFRELQADFGLLLCADEMVPFYEGLGWISVSVPLEFDQPGEKVTWPSRIMVLPRAGEKLPSKSIDLCGLPW